MPAVSLDETSHRPFPPPERKWLGAMVWRQLLFAHWPVMPQLLQRLLPEGVQVDTFEGQAYVGIIPFSMGGVRTRLTPAIPGMSAFPELNVRTYVRVNDQPGVWFFSLDADSRWFVAVARRQYRIPYYRAEMRIARQEKGWVHFESRRVHPGAAPAALVCRYRPTGEPAPSPPGSLAHWLTERYCLFTAGLDVPGYRSPSRAGQDGRGNAKAAIWRADIHHGPWQLAEAEWEVKTNAMFAPLGLPLPMTQPHLRFAAELPVVGWTPEVVAPAS